MVANKINPDFSDLQNPETITSHLQELKSKENDGRFPLMVFPEFIQNYIDELQAVLGYPQDFTAGAFLYSVSIGIGNTRVFELKKGMRAKANIFLTLVGRPGVHKSNPFQFALRRLHEIERNIEKEYLKELAIYEAEQEKPLKERDATIKKPILTNYLLNDFTPEVLAKELGTNARGLGIFADEILGWLLNLNKYNGGSNEESYLSLWNGFGYKVSRASKEQITVRNPFVSIAGTIQPERMKKAFSGKESNGFLDRLLFIYPDGLDSPKWNGDNIDFSNDDHFDNIITDLYRKLDFNINEFGDRLPMVITPSEKAKEVIIEWQRSFASSNDNEDEDTQSLGAKIENYILRFNLILHIIAWITGEESEEFVSSEQTARNAIILAEYFFAQAQKVRSYIYSNDIYTGLDQTKISFLEGLPKTFKAENAKAVAVDCGMSNGGMYRFLASSKYFKKISHGVYEKII